MGGRKEISSAGVSQSHISLRPQDLNGTKALVQWKGKGICLSCSVPGPIPGITYDSLCPVGSDLECRARSHP